MNKTARRIFGFVEGMRERARQRSRAQASEASVQASTPTNVVRLPVWPEPVRAGLAIQVAGILTDPKGPHWGLTNPDGSKWDFLSG